MRRLILFLFCLLPSIALAGSLGPLLRLWKDPLFRRGPLFEAAQAPTQPSKLRALAKVTGPLPEGVQVEGKVGNIASLVFAPELLPLIESTHSIERLDRPHILSTTLDLSTQDIGSFEARTLLGQGGQGSIVAIVDTGLDLRHPDFRNADGSTRVRYYLDLATSPEESGAEAQDPDGSVVEGFGGSVYDEAAINRALLEGVGTLPTDHVGHGTHVAGIAAGNGNATDLGFAAGRYVGVAPEADLIIVDAERDGFFSDPDLLNSLAFILDRAQVLGKPVVINLSLGGQSGPHDGRALLEEAFDTASGEGREGVAIVVSAGNDGFRDLHASTDVDGEESLEILVPPHIFRNGNGTWVLELWAERSEDVSVLLETPFGERLGPVRLGILSKSARFAAGDSYLLGSADEASPFVGTIAIAQEAEGLPVAAGTWKLRLFGSAKRVDAWLSFTNLGATRIVSKLDPDYRVSFPANAASAIAVGSYSTRSSWVRPDGEPVETGRTLGAVSRFSSFGPTRDFRLKPDISAPGEFVVAALSSDAPPTSPESVFAIDPLDLLLADDGLHGSLQGTSMSAPHVTGAIALLLATDPSLDAEEIRQLLQASARCDAFTGCALPNTRVGFGKLNIAAAVRQAQGEVAGPVSASKSSVGSVLDLIAPDGSQETQVIVSPRDETGLALGSGHNVVLRADYETIAGVLLRSENLTVRDLGSGLYEASLRGEFSAPGTPPIGARLVATVNGVELEATPKVYFALQREDIGRANDVGCMVSPQATSSGTWLLFAVVIWDLFRRRLKPQP